MRKIYCFYIGHEICIAVVFASLISLIFLKILDKKYIRMIDIIELNRFDDRIENKCQV